MHLKWLWKTLKKILPKITKNKKLKLSAVFSGFQGLTNTSYKFFRPLFNSQFFLSLNFLTKENWI